MYETGIEKFKLLYGSQSELDLFLSRTEEFAEGLSDEAKKDRDIYSIYDREAEATRRTGPVATFLIEACDFVDGLDHSTTDEIGGTNSVQRLVQEMRTAVRETFEEVRSNSI